MIWISERIWIIANIHKYLIIEKWIQIHLPHHKKYLNQQIINLAAPQFSRIGKLHDKASAIGLWFPNFRMKFYFSTTGFLNRVFGFCYFNWNPVAYNFSSYLEEQVKKSVTEKLKISTPYWKLIVKTRCSYQIIKLDRQILQISSQQVEI